MAVECLWDQILRETLHAPVVVIGEGGLVGTSIWNWRGNETSVPDSGANSADIDGWWTDRGGITYAVCVEPSAPSCEPHTLPAGC